MIAFALLVPASVIAAFAAALGMWWLPALLARRDRARLHAAILDDLPDVVDLLAVAVGAGCNVRLALAAVAPRSPGEVGRRLERALTVADEGSRLVTALEPLRKVEALRGLADALIDAELYGSPLVASLQRLSHEARALRRRDAEEAARRLPIALLFPLVLCVLPAFGLLTVVPLLAGSFQSLHL